MIRTSLMKPRYLGISLFNFSCPYCGKRWDRGGHKEGFVKAAANRHVHGCWEVWLYCTYQRFNGGWKEGAYEFLTESEAKKWPRLYKGVKALVRKRKRDGYAPRSERATARRILGARDG